MATGMDSEQQPLIGPAFSAPDPPAFVPAPVPTPRRRGFWRSLGRGVRWLWRTKWLRYGILFTLLFTGGLLAVVPSTRYTLLHRAGVRVSSSVIIIDDHTSQPLKNVSVRMGGVETKTDASGKAVLRDLPLGPAILQVRRAGFGAYERTLVLGWGSNPLGSIALKSVGMQYMVEVFDFITGKSIAGAEATNGDAVAVSDGRGSAAVIVPGTNEQLIDI